MLKITMKKQIPVFKPLIEKEEIDAAVASLELGWLGMGSYVKQFEDAIADVCQLQEVDDRYVVAVSTGHAALHLLLLMLGVEPGDEVITPSFNNAADFQAIRACGANPVFVDILEDTLCIDTSKIESLITEKTKCIIAMDYDIFICDHDRLKEIAQKNKIPVLHDAAHSFGSYYKSEPIGKQHEYTMFSFDPVKTITCIDGGAIVVKGKDKIKRLQAKRLIGMTQPASQMYENSRAWTYDIEELGFRYHMANLHAAIGVAQIKKLDDIRSSRQKTCQYYHSELSKLEWIHAPYNDFSSVNPFLYYIRILNGRRNELREHMKLAGIDTGIHWQAGHNFTYLKDCRRGILNVTEKITEQILSLPLHSKMSNEDVERVIDSIKSFEI
jgi:dTDP-4-amino-4,6-dideoxygalactose transaminase